MSELLYTTFNSQYECKKCKQTRTKQVLLDPNENYTTITLHLKTTKDKTFRNAINNQQPQVNLSNKIVQIEDRKFILGKVGKKWIAFIFVLTFLFLLFFFSLNC